MASTYREATFPTPRSTKRRIAGKAAESLQRLQDLRRAVSNQEFTLHYQPILDGHTKEVIGAEALVRWNHPGRGLLMPSEFIAAAEDSGIIVPLGEWVLRTACMEIAALSRTLNWRLKVCVNIAEKQFRQKDLPRIVQEALAASGLPGEDLELEITERTLLANTLEARSQLSRIRELNVQIAIDDFGTGYSSFKYVLEHQVDCLKIDRSFIARCPQDENASSIVRAIVAMAHRLNMRVVGEGVETKAQMDFLMRRRCDEVQGFLFYKPLPFAALRAVVENALRPSLHANTTRLSGHLLMAANQ